MKAGKCPSCGANIAVDESKEAGVCEFCGTPFVTEKAISTVTNNTTTTAQTINYYYSSAPANTNTNNSVKCPPRPEVNVFLAIILCWLWLIPGIIYIASVKSAQKEWDAQYRRR